MDAGGLEKFAKLDTTVTVIDCFTMLNDFDTAEFISSRRDDVTPEDERCVSDLMVDQIEFADVIVLNKMDMVSHSKIWPKFYIPTQDAIGRCQDQASNLDLDQETQPPSQDSGIKLLQGRRQGARQHGHV